MLKNNILMVIKLAPVTLQAGYKNNKAAEVSATCLSLGDNMSILVLCAFLEFLFFLENC